MNNGGNNVIVLDRIADSIEALKHPDERQRELNWRIWRQVQRRRVNQAMRYAAADFVGYRGPWDEMVCLSSRASAIEALYDERHGVSGAWPAEVE